MGIILAQGRQLNQCYWFINQINTSHSSHTSEDNSLHLSMFQWFWTLISSHLRHVSKGTAALSGSLIISLLYFQKILFSITYYNALYHSLDPTFLIPTISPPQHSSLSEMKPIFLWLQAKLCIYPLSEKQGSLLVITDINCQPHLIPPFWEGRKEKCLYEKAKISTSTPVKAGNILKFR